MTGAAPDATGSASAGPDGPLTVVIADDQALVRGGFRLILKAAGIEVLAEAADGEQAVTAVLEHRPDVVLMDIRMPRLDGIEATRRIVAALSAGAGVSGAGVPAAGNAGARAFGAGAGPGEPGAVPMGPTGPRIIILTTFDLDEYVYAALGAGASGFLLKDVTPEHLVAAVQLVRTGDALLAPSITRRLVERFAGRPGQPAHSAHPGQPGRIGSTAAPGASSWAPTASPPAGSSSALPGSPGFPGSDTSALTPREFEVLGLIARGMSNAEIAGKLFLSEATVKTHVARILTKLGLRDRVQAVVLAYESGLVSPGSEG